MRWSKHDYQAFDLNYWKHGAAISWNGAGFGRHRFHGSRLGLWHVRFEMSVMQMWWVGSWICESEVPGLRWSGLEIYSYFNFCTPPPDLPSKACCHSIICLIKSTAAQNRCQNGRLGCSHVMWPTQDLKQFEQFPKSCKLEDKYKYGMSWKFRICKNLGSIFYELLRRVHLSWSVPSTWSFLCLFFIIIET